MADWNDIKRAFERDAEKAEKKFVADEQKLLKTVTMHVCSLKGVSPLHGYNPNDILEFLSKPAPDIKKELGGDWLGVSDDAFETLVYSLSKKVKKSGQLISW